MSDPGTILVLVLAVPVGLGVLLAVLSGLEDSLLAAPRARSTPREPTGDDTRVAPDAAAAAEVAART